VKSWKGVSEETTTGVKRLYRMLEEGSLLVPTVNVNDTATKSKFDNLYGCRESLVDGIKRATDVDGRGQGRPRHAATATWARARPSPSVASAPRSMIAEIDPICALQAAMEGYRVVHRRGHRSVRPTSTSPPPATRTSSRLEHMLKMKDQAIVCNIGHFDNEIQVDPPQALTRA
jgi:adenosylhomocysteinase